MNTKKQRVACGDDLCTGILDLQGVCGYCGRKYSLPPGVEPVSNEDGDEVTFEEMHNPAAIDLPNDENDEDEFDLPAADLTNRIPCGDELCTGVLDTSGRCGYCDRSFPI